MVLLKIKNFAVNSLDVVTRIIKRSSEIKKFKDPRRKAIFETVQLSDMQKKQIDELFINNYGRKIPYTWHRHFTAYTGRFDVNYIPELLYIPEFERYMNIKSAYTKTLGDKNVLPLVAQSVGVKMPKTIIARCEGLYRNESCNMLTEEEVSSLLCNIGEVFAKPTVDTCSGIGCRLLNFVNGVDVISEKPIHTILTEMGDNFIIQERLSCHKSIADIYNGSVNTFRVITYRWRDTICTMPIIMRIGSGGSFLDNAHAGGMFIAVSDDGVLHKTAFTEFKKSFEKHPDSDLVFEGHRIECFEKVIVAAIKMHTAMAQIGVVNWDFSIDADGIPVLIEANMNGGSIWLIEMAHGCGVFGDKTEEILRWIKLMNSIPATERIKYAFGKTED